MNIADHIQNAEPVRQGSNVYKAVRIDGSIAAVQILPLSLSLAQAQVFEEQVTLLKELQFEYKAAVPRVLSWGFTKTGFLPYIEMEWINGPSLAEIQKEKKLLTIEEVSQVAEEVARVMAQCYRLHLKHGNICGDTVLWDIAKKRYVVTGFLFGLQFTPVINKKGISIIPPVAPAANENDVKHVGTLLLHLLTGKNYLTASKDINKQRRQLLLEASSEESTVPYWLSTCINKSLGMNEAPFESTVEQYSYILAHYKKRLENNRFYRSQPQPYFGNNAKPPLKPVTINAKNVKLLLSSNITREKAESWRFVFDRNIAFGLLIAVWLLGFSIYAQNKENKAHPKAREVHLNNDSFQTTTNSATAKSLNNVIAQASSEKNFKTKKPAKEIQVRTKKKAASSTDSVSGASSSVTATSYNPVVYKVRSKAYFHNNPDESTRRNAFIVHWNNAILHPLKEENGFVYIVFTNDEGQTTKGWLKKSDLIKQ